MTAAPIGCLISWANEAVNSPIVLTRFRCDEMREFLP